MDTNFRRWAVSHDWIIKDSNSKCKLSTTIVERYKKIPSDWLSFINKFNVCMNSTETTWFLLNENYMPKNENEWRYNEFEILSLESAQDDNEWIKEIHDFWDNNLPIIMSVGNGYEYYAIEIKSGAIVHGIEPEFEDVEKVANSFNDFINLIIDGKIEI